MRKVITLPINNDPSPSISYWCNLLNFTHDNADKLSVHQLIDLETECERCRLFWNTDRFETEYVAKNGKVIEIQVKRIGLGVEKKDVTPNIYEIVNKKVAAFNVAQKKTAAEGDEVESVPQTAVLA